MNPEEFKRAIAEKMDEIQRYRDQDLPHVVGKEAVDHFDPHRGNLLLYRPALTHNLYRIPRKR